MKEKEMTSVFFSPFFFFFLFLLFPVLAQGFGGRPVGGGCRGAGGPAERVARAGPRRRGHLL
jgi:hypothetical protein